MHRDIIKELLPHLDEEERDILREHLSWLANYRREQVFYLIRQELDRAAESKQRREPG